MSPRTFTDATGRPLEVGQWAKVKSTTDRAAHWAFTTGVIASLGRSRVRLLCLSGCHETFRPADLDVCEPPDSTRAPIPWDCYTQLPAMVTGRRALHTLDWQGVDIAPHGGLLPQWRAARLPETWTQVPTGGDEMELRDGTGTCRATLHLHHPASNRQPTMTVHEPGDEIFTSADGRVITFGHRVTITPDADGGYTGDPDDVDKTGIVDGLAYRAVAVCFAGGRRRYIRARDLTIQDARAVLIDF